DPLDGHPSVAAYRAAKARIFENQDEHDWTVVNADDPTVLEMARRSRARHRLFSRDGSIPDGTVVERDWIVDRGAGRGDVRLVPMDAVHLIGPHLVHDVMA